MFSCSSKIKPIAVVFAFSSFLFSLSVMAKDAGVAKKEYLPLKPTSQSAEGKRLIVKNQCNMCHTMEGKGGCIAPPFDGIGGRRTKEFLLSRITDEDKEEAKFLDLYGESELMPHVRVPRVQSTKIVTYLLTLPRPQRGFKVVGHAPPSKKRQADLKKIMAPQLGKQPGQSTALDKDAERGKKLLAEKGCQACHSIGKIGGDFGPSLDHIGSRRDVLSIAEQILSAELASLTDERQYGKKPTRMPASDLSMEDIKSIARFLETLK